MFSFFLYNIIFFLIFYTAHLDYIFKYSFNTIGVCLSFSLLYCFIPNKKKKIVFIFFSMPFCLFNLLSIGAHLLGLKLGYQEMISILISNKSEVFEFLITRDITIILGAFLISFLPFFFMLFLRKNIYLMIKEFEKIFLFTYTCCFWFGGFFIVELVSNNEAIQAAYDLVKQQYSIAQYEFLDLSDIKEIDSSKDKKLYVVIISDSVSSHYMSLYNFSIDTTPFLDSIKNNLYVFNRVKSDYNFTYQVLEHILNIKEKENINLLAFFKNVGFKTYWISSHPQYGFFNKFSNYSSCSNESYFRVCEEDTTDKIVFSKFENALNDVAEKKIIFLHLQGSHHQYSQRFPSNFASDDKEFLDLKKENVDTRYIDYLKSIKYSDLLLKDIFNLVKSKKEYSSYILYLSDHGEDVSPDGNANFCHGGVEKERVFEIPFVLWLSDTYKRNNQEFVSSIGRNLSKEYSIKNLFHSIVELSRLSHEKIDSRKSIFYK